MSALTKRTTLTGNEEFQVSATEKVTAQQIADLADTGVKVVIVTNFKTNVWTELGQNTNIFDSIPIGEMVVFKSADDAASGPGEALIGYAIKYSNLMVTYVGMTTNNGVSVIPTLYTHKSAGVYDTKWQKLPDTDNGGVQTVEITDFAIPSVNITKDGQSFLFYANDASNIPNTNNGATSFVGVAIASPIFITGDQRLLYYMMVDTARGMFYTGCANLEDDTVAWNNTPVTRLGQAVHVTAFTESALSSLLYTYKAGDFIPFYTGNVTTSTANQFPESGIFNGFISMGSNEGDYFQIFAFKSGSTKAYLGACIGSTTQWTALGGGGTAEPIVVADAESVATVVDSSTFPLGMYTAPIPGYTKVNDGYIDCSPASGSITVASLTRPVPPNTTCFIEADVCTSVTGGVVKASSALMFFRFASGSTMCDMNSRVLGGIGQGQVKLDVATINSQTSFIILTTSYDLDYDLGEGVIRIKNIYAKL